MDQRGDGGTQCPSSSESEDLGGDIDAGTSRELLRMNYRDLIDEVRESKDTMNSQQISSALTKGDALFAEVQRHPQAREGTLDAEFYDLAIQVSVNNANKLVTGFKEYTLEQIVEKIPTIITDKNFYRTYVAGHIIQETPSRIFLYGALDRSKPTRLPTERKQRDKETDKEAIQPKNIDQSNIEEQDLTKRVKKLNEKLVKRTDKGSVELGAFITDPKSFATSVENLFHFSFLVQEGNAKLENTSANVMIESTATPKQKGLSADQIKSQQTVMKFDYTIWQENKRKFEAMQNNSLEESQPTNKRKI